MTAAAAVLAVVAAHQPFNPSEPDCLALTAGDRILVFKHDASGWSYGARSGPDPAHGWFPANFCQAVDEDESKLVMEEEAERAASLEPGSLVMAAQTTLASGNYPSGASVSIGDGSSVLGAAGSVLATSDASGAECALSGEHNPPRRFRATPILTVATNIAFSSPSTTATADSAATLVRQPVAEHHSSSTTQRNTPASLLYTFHNHLAALTSASTTAKEKHVALQQLLAVVRALFRIAPTSSDKDARVKDMKREVIDALRELGEAGKLLLGFGRKQADQHRRNRSDETLITPRHERDLWDQLRARAERVRQAVEWYVEMVDGEPEIVELQTTSLRVAAQEMPATPTSPTRAFALGLKGAQHRRGASSADVDRALLTYLDELHGQVRASANVVLRRLTTIKRESVSSRMTSASTGSGGASRLYAELSEPVRDTLHHAGQLLSFVSDLRIPDAEELVACRDDPAAVVQASMINAFSHHREAVYAELNDLFTTAATYVNLPAAAAGVAGAMLAGRASMDIEDLSSSSTSGLMLISQAVTSVSSSVGALVEVTRTVIPLQRLQSQAAELQKAASDARAIASKIAPETPESAYSSGSPMMPAAMIAAGIKTAGFRQESSERMSSPLISSSSITFPPVRSQSPSAERRSPAPMLVSPATVRKLRDSSSVVAPHPLRIVTSTQNDPPDTPGPVAAAVEGTHRRKISVALLEAIEQHEQRRIRAATLNPTLAQTRVFSFVQPLPFSSRYSAYSSRAVLQGTVEYHAPAELRGASIHVPDRLTEATWGSRDKAAAVSNDESSALLRVHGGNVSGASPLGNAKVIKFFGVESHAARATTEDRSLWFIKRGYPPTDVTYNMENQLTGGTWEALVEMLTPHDGAADPDYSSVFLLTFRCFSTPQKLLEALESRFFLVPPPELNPDEVAVWTDRVQSPVRLRVFNVLKSWLESYFFDGFDDACLDKMQSFAEIHFTGAMSQNGSRLGELIARKAHPAGQVTAISTVNKSAQHLTAKPAASADGLAPNPIVTKQLLNSLRNRASISITDIDVLELARQLTIMDSKQFCAIQPYELIGLAWTKKDSRVAVNVRNMSAFSVNITTWIAEQIVYETDVKKRAGILKYAIKLADKCSQLNNYNTLMSILGAINSTTIERLWKTWALVPNRHRVVLSELRKSSDHKRNYAEYRARLRDLAPPAIPFVGLYLTDLVFTADGNPDYRRPLLVLDKENPPQIINYDKYARSVRIVREMQRFQGQPHALQGVAEVQDWVREGMEKGRSGGDVAKLFEQSQLIEPPAGVAMAAGAGGLGAAVNHVPLSPVQEEFGAGARG